MVGETGGDGALFRVVQIMRPRRGSALVESALVLLLFIVILLGIMDFGQILFFHHILTERARAGARYAAVHAWDVAAVQRYVARNDASAGTGRRVCSASRPPWSKYSIQTWGRPRNG